MSFTKEKNKTTVLFFLLFITGLFYYPNAASAEDIVSEVTVEVYRESPIFVDTAQKLLPKTNEKNGLFLSWIGLFLIMTYWILLQLFKNKPPLEH